MYQAMRIDIELYGQGVALVRRKKIDLDAAAERLELPAEALGALLVTVIGKGRVLVENHRGIEQYSEEYIRLGAQGGAVSVYGSGIRMRSLYSYRSTQAAYPKSCTAKLLPLYSGMI